jgi:maltodextrin utilization protein YvdJ
VLEVIRAVAFGTPLPLILVRNQMRYAQQRDRQNCIREIKRKCRNLGKRNSKLVQYIGTHWEGADFKVVVVVVVVVAVAVVVVVAAVVVVKFMTLSRLLVTLS